MRLLFSENGRVVMNVFQTNIMYTEISTEFLHQETNIICMIHIAFSFNVKLKTPNTHYMFDSYITKNIKHIIIRFKFIGIISL